MLRIHFDDSAHERAVIQSSHRSSKDALFTKEPLAIILLSLLFLPTPLLARTWRIGPNGSGDAANIQEGIRKASAGDIVLAEPGTYYENIDFLGKDIVVRSEAGPDVTTLDGSLMDSSVVVFKKGETRAAVLEGFTITGGTGSSTTRNMTREGGGIYCIFGSPIIRGNRIIANRTSATNESGGGMLVGTGFAEDGLSAPLIDGNLFENNYSNQNGGGLGLLGGSEAEVRNNVFRNNQCRADGGGIWAWIYQGSAMIHGNELYDNVAGDHGGGMYAANPGHAGPFTISNNLFIRNKTLGPGFFGDTGSGGGLAALTITGRIEHNTFVANDGHHLTDCGGGGLLLYGTTPELLVTGNILVLNKQCGIACWWNGTAIMGPNLVWFNEPSDLGIDLGECPITLGEQFIVGDPLFCGAAVDDYHVAADSPAIVGGEVLGAFSKPGCGPVPVRLTTWGRIKSLF